MYRTHLLSLGARHLAGFGLCLAPETEGTGGGSATPGSDAGAMPDTTAADGGDGDPGSAAASAAGDDDGDELSDFEQAIDHLPEQNVRTQLRRAQRRMRTTRPLLERLRDPQTGRYVQPTELDRMRFESSEFRAIDRVLQANPDLVQQIVERQRRLDAGETAPSMPGASAQADATGQVEDQPWNDETYPYERETEQGQFLYNALKNAHEANNRVRALERRFQTREQRDQQTEVQQLETRWKDATTSASQQLQDAARRPFVRYVYQQFVTLRDTGRLTKANAQGVINDALQTFGAFRAAAPANNATTQRQSQMAAGNQQLPRVPRPGAMTPTHSGSSGTGQRETLAAARGSMFRRFGKESPKV